MTMKVGTRILLTIFLLAIIGICVFILGTLFGYFSPEILDNISYTMISDALNFKILYGAIAVVFIVIAIILMFFGIRKETPRTVKIESAEGGSVLITVNAIEDLVHKHVQDTPSATEVRSKVTSFEEYIEIDSDIDVLPGVEIPALTQGLQDSLKGDLEKYTGIRVNAIRIRVLNIKENNPDANNANDGDPGVPAVH